ncbi:MAG: chromate resistance protein ChrB domain-containing protein [bacterium]
MRKLQILKGLFLLFSFLVVVEGVFLTEGATKETESKAKKERNIYTTWHGNLEVDKCGSAWLIKRFIDKEAKFKFFKHGTLIKEGIPFDTPTAKLRQSRNMSTFEVIIQKYKIDDPVIDRIAKIVRDIEINIWGEKVTEEALGLQAIIRGLNLISKDDYECLERSFIVFDALYADVKSQADFEKKER